MKHLNQRTEAIIESNTKVVDYNISVKEGDVVLHKEVVESIKIFVPKYNEQGFMTGHSHVWFTKDDVLSIAEQIVEIESKQFEKEYESDLPF